MNAKEDRRIRFNSQSLTDRKTCVEYFGKYLYSTYFNPILKIDVYIVEGDEPSHDELVEVWVDVRFNKVTDIRIPSFEQLDILIDEIQLPELWQRKR
jgi:hypothetical protein